MSNNAEIKTIKSIFPQIYAYVIPNYPQNEGWIKIGYTERHSVDDRIREQTGTAGISYDKLWSEPAKFIGQNKLFTDKQFHSFLIRFKKIKRRPSSEWFYYDGTPEKSHDDFDDFRNGKMSQADHEYVYQLRAEQKKAVEITRKYIKSHPDGEFLWNAKPRFGKTLTTYDLVCKLKAMNVLIVTNRPAIACSWYDDFEKYIAWQKDYNYRFVSTTDTLKNRSVLSRDDYLNELDNQGENPLRCISFISLQDLKGGISFGGDYDKLKWVKDLHWDLLVIDEAHEGVDTIKTDVAFNNIQRKFTLYLSGTPFKAIASGHFSQEQIFNWTYADEQDAKANWPANSEENNPYERLPKLNLFSYQMSQMITDQVNRGAEIDGEEIDFAFDLNEFFATNPSGQFWHEQEVRKWLDTLTRNEKYPFSTPELREELKHTLWILNRVASAKALAKLLKSHPVFENYEIVLAAGDGKTDDDSDEISQKSLDKVRKALSEYKKTITLSVGQLTTGVTIPEWTAVMVLSNIKSASLYMQAAFRAQNPWSFEINDQTQRKQNAYVFDFAPERTLMIYDEFANNLNSKTAAGGGTTEDREANIRKLINFFPVIAEDNEGKMVELDVRQVLTFPKKIKAQEVVKRGFMCNFLFQNISRIFGTTEARNILEQLNPVPQGKTTPTQTSAPIDTQNIQLNEQGNVTIPKEIAISQSDARFGSKVYENITEDISKQEGTDVADIFTNHVLDIAKELGKENSITSAQTEQIVKNNAHILERQVETIKRQTDISRKEAENACKLEIAAAGINERAIAEAKNRYEEMIKNIDETCKKQIDVMVQDKTPELAQKLTEEICVKGEEKKKVTVEEDVRARLRGFTRTIPSFLMAYGEPGTSLANFDEKIEDDVFQEVTGITLDQFRKLRDTYQFFDATVFDESVQEFLRKKKELANYFDETQTEDIFDYIPPQRTNQIFTPRAVVKLMLDKMEEEDPNLFTDPNRTFADLYVKSGLYLTEIVKRLFCGLKNTFPDKNNRLKHILKKQIYGFAPSKIIYNIAKNFIFGNFENIDDSNLICQDLTNTAKNGDTLDMNFDVVVGNPPYQDEAVGSNNQAIPIYNLFYNLAEQISPIYCLISPARFLANQGATTKAWNKKMLNDEHLTYLYFNPKSDEVFPNTDIKGGVVVIYRNKNKSLGPINTFIPFEELRNIYCKVNTKTSSNMSSLVFSPDSYRFTDMLFEENPKLIGRTDDSHSKAVASSVFERYPEIFFENKPKDKEDYIQIYGRLNGDRIYRYIKRKYLAPHPNLDKWKVFIPGANGTGAIGEILSTPVIGEPVIGEPVIGHNQTFVSLGKFDTEFEAVALLKYIKSKFARSMLGIMKTTQNNQSPITWSKVPLQDFTPSSDIDWTQSIPEIDRQLYAKYGLTKKEIAFIEEKVRPMEE